MLELTEVNQVCRADARVCREFMGEEGEKELRGGRSCPILSLGLDTVITLLRSSVITRITANYINRILLRFSLKYAFLSIYSYIQSY